MKNKPQTKKADEKSNYKKELDQIGSQSNFEKENTNLLKQMYVGKRNNPNTKTAGSLELDESEVDNPPVIAVDREYPDEGFDSDQTEKQFFVDDHQMETEGLRKMVDLQKTFTNPAGAKDTAPRQSEGPDVSASNKTKNKVQARQSARELQAKVANAKNLAEMMFRKRLIAREQIPAVAKLAVQLENKGFGLLKQIVEAMDTTQTQGRTATASVNSEKGLKQPLHVARAAVKGSRFEEEFSDAPWDGMPPSGYDHSKHTSH